MLKYFTKAKSQILYSNKKKYLDFSMSSGAMILGHSNEIFKKVLKKNLQLGSNFSFTNIYQRQYKASLLNTFPEFKDLVFSNSGSEANIRAIRSLRAITKKNKLAMVNGSWHGSIDDLMFDLKHQKKKRLNQISLSSGIDHNKQNTILLPYNDIRITKEILLKEKKNLAAVVIEPIQCSVPSSQSLKYLQQLYSLCKNHNILLWFDEIITGLRVNNLTIFRQLNIKPNIVTFAKCFGGGLPIGITCFDRKISNSIKKLNKTVFFGGTFSGNLLSTSVGMETFKYIKKNHKKINSKITNLSKNLVKEINNFCEKSAISFRLQNFESIVRPIFSNRTIINKYLREDYDKKFSNSLKLKNFLEKNKIFISGNCCFFISYCHTIKDIKKLVKILKKYLTSSNFKKEV